MAYNSVAYVWNLGGPGRLQDHIADIQASRLTSVILFGIHIGRVMPEIPKMKLGDLIYNDYASDPGKGIRGNLLVSEGRFNPNNDTVIAAWPAQVAQLKKRGSVSKVLVSVGGASNVIYDFRTIEDMFRTGKAGLLKQNIAVLRQALTIDGVCALDGFDIDNEEDVSPDTIVQFCQMLFEQGFEVTFYPYSGQDDWRGYMQTLWNKGMKVSWWNLQCYAGGGGNLNDLSPWIEALAAVVGPQAASSYLVPGLAVSGVEDVGEGEQHCPWGAGGIAATATDWRNPRLGGVFLWKYDALAENPGLCTGQNNLKNYVQAINEGLSKG